jgi:hypothetical protein
METTNVVLRRAKEKRKEDWRRWILVRIAVMTMPMMAMDITVIG